MNDTLISRVSALVPTPALFRQTPFTRTRHASTRREPVIMDNRQRRTVQTFERILLHLERHPAQPEPPLLARMKRSLATSIARLRELQREQDAATIGVSGRRSDRCGNACGGRC